MKKLITLFFLICSNAVAQFNGFPISQNYTNADANWIATNIHPMQQLYSGVVERVNLINNGGSTITPLELVNTYVCSAGTGFSYTVDGSNTYTNILLFTTNITVTNQFSPFVYSYSDTSGVHSATAMPFVTRGMISDIDEKLDELIPYFMARSFASNGNYTFYFSTNRDPYLGATPYVIPTESKAGLFHRAGIGFATNLSTNVWGFVNGGDAYYTRQPAHTNLYILAEGTFTSNSWQTRDKYNLDRYYYKTNAPIIRYYTGGTNPITTIDITLAGSYLKQDDQTTVATSKTYTVTGSNTPLDLVWYSVTNILSASDSFNTNDVYAVVYTNRQFTYGSAIDKYFLTSSDYDERYRVLTNLCWTKYSNEDYDHPEIMNVSTGRVFDPTNTDHNLAGLVWGSNWTEAITYASNILANTSNWYNVTNAVIEELVNGSRTVVETFTGDSPYDFQIYLGGVAGAGVYEIYEGYGNAPTNQHDFMMYRYARGFQADGDPYYYNFVSPNYKRYYELDASLVNLTNSAYQLPLTFYGNPLADLPSPTSTNAVQRFQILTRQLMIFKWEDGLLYK